MTVAIAPTAPTRTEDVKPLPWRRMAWVIWRQHRLALTGVVLLLGVLAVYLWLSGRQVHQAFAAATACHPAGSIACVSAISNFTSTYDHTATIIPALLQAVPALIGAFLGAPLLARELESGTFRYAWTQGFGRWRWTLAKLVSLAVASAAAAGVFSLLFSWYDQPFIANGQSNPLAAIIFDLRGVAFASWTLVAFAIGALAGILTRRVVPSIIATLAAYTGLAYVVRAFVRHHYLTPLVTSVSVPASALITSSWGTKDGRVAFVGNAPLNLLEQYCPPSALGPGKPSSGSFVQCLDQHGYTLWTSYQPANRFWAFQGIEATGLLALSLLLLTMTAWLVRRRAA
jgi:ABC-2 family transporter protein